MHLHTKKTEKRKASITSIGNDEAPEDALPAAEAKPNKQKKVKTAKAKAPIEKKTKRIGRIGRTVTPEDPHPQPPSPPLSRSVSASVTAASPPPPEKDTMLQKSYVTHLPTFTLHTTPY